MIVTVASVPELSPKVIELLAAIVAAGGEAMGSDLETVCELGKPQLKRLLRWMEKQDLTNQAQGGGGRMWVRATVSGRDALKRARLGS